METSDALGASASEFDRDVRAALAALPEERLHIDVERTRPGVFAYALVLAEDMDFQCLTLGAEFSEGTLHADEVHNQLFFFPESPTPLSMLKDGPAEFLVSAVDEWLSEIVSRDAFEDEWVHRGRVFASATRLAGYGDVTMSFDESLAPRGLKLRLLVQGSYQGKGWINPRGISAPTRSTKTRLICWGQDGPS